MTTSTLPPANSTPDSPSTVTPVSSGARPTSNGLAVDASAGAFGDEAWRHGPLSGVLAQSSDCRTCDRFKVLGDPESRDDVTSPEAAAALLVPELSNADRERCLAALLDTKHRVIGVVVVSIGSLDHTFMAPREVFRDALLANAAAIVLAHNHPSGDVEPSSDDEAVTRRLVRAGELVGVEVLDHLIVGRDRWTSLARRGVV